MRFEGNAGMSIHACRSAQQSVHAQTEVDKHQLSVDVACDITVSVFQCCRKSRTLSWWMNLLNLAKNVCSDWVNRTKDVTPKWPTMLCLTKCKA